MRQKEQFRVARGLLDRLAAFCPILEDEPSHTALDSLAGQVYAKAHPKSHPSANASSNSPLDADIVKLALRLKSLNDQLRLLDRFKGGHHYEVLRVLILGEEFCEGEIDRRAFESLDNVDFSLVSVSILVKIITAADDRVSRLLLHQIDSHMRGIGFEDPTDCSTLAKGLQSFGLKTELNSLAQINDAFYALKQISWPLFGSDLLVFMHSLADPTASLSRYQLEHLSLIASAWKLGPISNRLIALRAINCFEDERAFMCSAATAFHNPQDKEIVRTSAKAIKANEMHLRAKYQKPPDPIETAVLFSELFYWYLDQKELNKLLRLVRDQYERDPSSLAFLNWNVFHEKMGVDWGQNYLLNILLSVILLSPNIGSRFESIEFSYGEGFVTNQILNYVNFLRERNQSVAHFARYISAMGQQARSTIATFVLQKSVIEVYAYAFRNRPPVTKVNIQTADLEVCHARMRLAYLFKESGTLTPEFCDRIIQEESAFRKMYRFQEVFRSSRIRIDWKYLESEISEVLEDDFGFFFNPGQLKKKTLSSSVAEIVAAIVGERLCQLILFESSTSLERALSNNLRHGVVVPRFLRLFTDAISNQTFSKPLSGQTNRGWYEGTFAQGGARLFDLEEEIIAAIGSYQIDWLKVDQDGPLYSDLQSRIVSTILKVVSKPEGFSLHALIADLIAVQKVAISSILDAARDALNGAVKSNIEALLSVARIDISHLNDKGSSEFLDSLSINLTAAFEDVSGWISLFDAQTTNSMAFEIGDLIDEESNTFIISDRSRSRIRYECVDRRTGQPSKATDVRVSGRSFELFDQIIHNCVSNARKRSGLRNETSVSIRITIEANMLTVWFGNNFAKDRWEEIKRHQENAKQIVAAALPSKGSKRRKKPRVSYREGGYGFVKIIDACENLLDAPPQFNFPIIGSPEGLFIVEIKLFSTDSILA